ncbi:MAG: hypothetical protein IPL10_15345 [Bacteroidetes bacterium]|nr:hypothetical protein [Bacteroidota bacterium]
MVIRIDFIQCPDIAQTVVCTCIGLKIAFKFTGLQTLKVKETDRIVALQNELQKFGCAIEITDNSIQWQKIKSEPFNNLSVATYHDHRMAMSFAPLCLLYENIIIENAEVVSKSYPLFWEDVKHIGINQTQLLTYTEDIISFNNRVSLIPLGIFLKIHLSTLSDNSKLYLLC